MDTLSDPTDSSSPQPQSSAEPPLLKHTLPGTSVPTRFARATFVPIKEAHWSEEAEQGRHGPSGASKISRASSPSPQPLAYARTHSSATCFCCLCPHCCCCCCRVADRDRDACKSCARPFHLLRRKHHCRGDAEIYCSSCSRYRLIAKAHSYEIVHVRVCAACFDLHAAPEGDSLHQPLAAPAEPASPLPPAATTDATTTDSVDPSSCSANTTAVADVAPTVETCDVATSPIVFHTAAAISTVAVAASHSSSPPFKSSAAQPRKIAGVAGGLIAIIVLMCTEGGVPWSAGFMILALVGAAGTGLHARKQANSTDEQHTATVAPVAANVVASAEPPTCAVTTVRTVTSFATVTTVTTDARAHASKSRSSSDADIGRPPVAGTVPTAALRTRPRSLTQQLTEAHSAVLPSVRHASLHTSSSFPNGFVRASSADLDAPGAHPATHADLTRLGLSREDAELVLLSRAGLATVQSYHRDLDGWRTHIRTRPDGRGRVKLADRSHVDFDALAAAGDNTIVVQSKFFPRSKSAAARTVWKGVCVLPCPPSHVFRLLLDQDNQCEWNTALIQSKVLRTIPHTRTSISYSVSAPAVGGAVSSREFIDTHDWSVEARSGPGSLAADGGAHVDYAFAGVGLDKSVFPHPPTASFVRGLNGPAGFLLRSIDAPQCEGGARGRSLSDAVTANGSVVDPPDSCAAAATDPDVGRWTQLVVVLDTDVRGWVPRSLTDGAMPDVVLEYLTNFQRVWKERMENKTAPPPMPIDAAAATIAAQINS